MNALQLLEVVCSHCFSRRKGRRCETGVIFLPRKSPEEPPDQRRNSEPRRRTPLRPRGEARPPPPHLYSQPSIIAASQAKWTLLSYYCHTNSTLSKGPSLYYVSKGTGWVGLEKLQFWLTFNTLFMLIGGWGRTFAGVI